jgi:hypothetical protein
MQIVEKQGNKGDFGGRRARFSVRDIGLAAFLFLKGCQLVNYFMDSHRRVVFQFEGDSQTLRKWEEAYRVEAEESKVPARKFYEAYMNIRSLAISIARQAEEVRARKSDLFD